VTYQSEITGVAIPAGITSNAILPGPTCRTHQFYQLPHHPLKQIQTNPRRHDLHGHDNKYLSDKSFFWWQQEGLETAIKNRNQVSGMAHCKSLFRRYKLTVGQL
jgi:hypothetical protein